MFIDRNKVKHNVGVWSGRTKGSLAVSIAVNVGVLAILGVGIYLLFS